MERNKDLAYLEWLNQYPITRIKCPRAKLSFKKKMAGLVSSPNHLLLYRDFSLHFIISNRMKRLHMLPGTVKCEYLTWLCYAWKTFPFIHVALLWLTLKTYFEPELHSAEHEADYRPSSQGCQVLAISLIFHEFTKAQCLCQA